ncbi:MAG: hypothetical protein KC454_06690 [Flavobacteriales bacterium]|nr:hypothetical protein [Flavobacteriales bacterium]
MSKAITIHSRLSLLVIILTTSAFNLLAQEVKEPFIGLLEYKISARDTSLKDFLPDYPMVIYSNDTIIRKSNFTDQLGIQVVIQHMVKNKSYLLLEAAQGKYAIQTDLNKTNSDTIPSKYTFKKKCFKKKILGIKAKRTMAYHPDFEEAIEFLYFDNRANKYNPVFKEIPGLPVKYSVYTPDGILDYELVKMTEYTPDRNLFGIPTDYKRVTFDEFLKIVTSPENQKVLSTD